MHCQFMFMTDGVLTATLPEDKQAVFDNFRIAEYYMRNKLHTYDSMQ